MAAKGLIFLDSRSAILYEQLQPRILEGKREPCEITFCDFDEVSFKISCAPENPNVVTVHMGMKNIPILKQMGSQAVIDRLFPGCETTPADGYNLAIQFDCDTLTDPAAFLTNVSELRKNVMGGPLDHAFSNLLAKTSVTAPPIVVEYRKNESMFVCTSPSKVVVIFLVDFADATDKAVAKVFLQEFVEAQRTVRTAPPVNYSKDAPGELLGASSYNIKADAAGFLSFALEERHVSGAGKDKAIALLTGFRNYLHYHIKCSKTYLHMRMRKRVAGWMQVLNRAMPEVESEKKTAAGKTFSRK
jgi:actin related protein 2/3 complex subunit 2